MKRQTLIALVAALTAGLIPWNAFEAHPQTSTAKSPSLLLVIGSGWNTCGDWKDWSETLKLGYAMGHADGISQVQSFLGDEPRSYIKIKDGFSSSYGLTYGQLTKAVDDFCSDFRNVKIPAVNAMMLVSGSIAGYQAYDDKLMRTLRCQAAAGDDLNKASECSNQP